MSKEDIEKQLAERLAGWHRLPNGDIAHMPYIESAAFPMADGRLAVALRFDSGRKDQGAVEQIQLGLSPRQCRNLAAQLLEGAVFLENELTPSAEKPN